MRRASQPARKTSLGDWESFSIAPLRGVAGRDNRPQFCVYDIVPCEPLRLSHSPMRPDLRPPFGAPAGTAAFAPGHRDDTAQPRADLGPTTIPGSGTRRISLRTR
ncbi:hypothetical protein AURDEDRAFT_112314 [Auricularia subglabra TFB-10046 SS5]|nr:hypothetical protein AURDEDRAFT_112314 [Auricularia subglabra TFB-10046 SS5]